MAKYRDEDFIKQVLEQCYVSQNDIDKCLAIKADMSAVTGIGEILRDQKHIDDKQYNVIVTLIKYKTGPIKKTEKIKTEKQKLKDRSFAEIAIRLRLITEEQLIECVELQKTLEQDGEARDLAYVMMRKGYLDENDLAFIEEGGAQATMKYTKEESVELIERLSKHTVPKNAINQVPVLQVLKGEKIGKRYTLNKKEITIGRVRGADIRINDSYVSRIHCKIACDRGNGIWEIIDMMSTHGVYVNTKKIVKKQELCSGDQISVGETTLEFMS